MKRLWLILCAATLAVPVGAQTVSVNEGNIQFTDNAGQTTALTSSGRDSSPLLAPDGKWVVFVRKVDGKPIATGSDEVEPTELWQVRVDGKEATLLVKTRDTGKPETGIAAFGSLQFSTNGKLLYFVTPAWAVTGAVYVVDTTNRKVRYLFPGSDVKVVPSGEYKDHLLVLQHRYFVGGGSYDWYWLVRADGKEIGPVGETTENFEATYSG